MAEYRPYRVINAGAQARLTQVKLVTVSGFIAAGGPDQLASHAAHGATVRLCAGAWDRRSFGRLYAPWEWIVWWSRWHWVEHFHPVWELMHPRSCISPARAGCGNRRRDSDRALSA